MVDVHDKKTRSRNMAAVRGKNTKPELLLRSELFRQGFRFRLHYGGLPGKPDIVLPKYRAVIQVHGCFWHGHHCALFHWPATREDFWRKKITENAVRDQPGRGRVEGSRVARADCLGVRAPWWGGGYSRKGCFASNALDPINEIERSDFGKVMSVGIGSWMPGWPAR